MSKIVIPQEAIERLRAARNIVALTGAGISAESGIPTFRAPGTGLWSQYRVEDFATPGAWRRNSALVWSWYSHRRRLAYRAQPNPAHLALAELERRTPNMIVVTQNVDGLHQRAGSRTVIELHGSLFRFRCADDDTAVAWEDPNIDNAEALERLERGELEAPPVCPQCGAQVRPDIVWFEEPMPRKPWGAAANAAQACDVCLVIGTSALVYPAASLPQLAKASGAYLIEINPEATDLTRRANWSAQARAGVALPELLRALESSAG